MKRATRSMLLLVALAFISVGCAHDRETWHDKSLLRSTPCPDDTIPVLNEIANNSLGTEEDRARAIFTLFGRYLRPGCSASELHEILTDVNWLRDARLYRIRAYTGWIPIDFQFPDSVFHIYLFPVSPDKRARQWRIYFRLTGDQQEEDALNFFQGTAPAGATPKMAEFTLCFPHSIYHPDKSFGRMERFSTRGVHVYEEWGH